MNMLFFIVLIIMGSILFLLYLSSRILTLKKNKKYGRISTSFFIKVYYEKINKIMSKSKFFVFVNREIAYRISMFNTLSMERNKEISLFFILGYIMLIIVVALVMVGYFWPYWYIGLFYALIFNFILFLILQYVTDLLMDKCVKLLPETIKILQSRFLLKKNIDKAIHSSLSDLSKGIKAEMIRIYDALKQNDVYKAKLVFREIDLKYSNEHISVLLDLIWLAHFNGGEESIKKQFNLVLNDVLEDIENQKDLKGASIGYVILAVLFIPALALVKMYNSSMLSKDYLQYYNSRNAIVFVAIYVLFILIFIGILIYLKKRG